MRKVYEDMYSHTVPPGRVVCCHLTVYKAAGGIVAIARELRGNRSMVAEHSASLAQAVWQAHGAPGRFTWIEERAPGLRIGPGCSLAEFTRRPDGTFTGPHRRAVSREAVAALIAQDYAAEWPTGWLSVPAQGLCLECLGCRRRLNIGAILSNARYCPTCERAGAAALAPPCGPPNTHELLRAREEFRLRIATHEEKLGLSPPQRMRLFQILAGPRSLWEFRPEELRALADQIEEFDSVAEVDEYIDVHQGGEQLV
jgi:hypothetical protein